MEKEDQVVHVLGEQNSSDQIVLDSDPSGLSKYDGDEFIDLDIQDVSAFKNPEFNSFSLDLSKAHSN